MRLTVLAIVATLALPATAAVAQDIGIAACDNFLKTYSSCVAAKVPEAQRGAMTTAIEQIKGNWKAVAATPEGKTQLEATCKQTAEQIKTQAASLGCQW